MCQILRPPSGAVSTTAKAESGRRPILAWLHSSAQAGKASATRPRTGRAAGTARIILTSVSSMAEPPRLAMSNDRYAGAGAALAGRLAAKKG